MSVVSKFKMYFHTFLRNIEFTVNCVTHCGRLCVMAFIATAIDVSHSFQSIADALKALTKLISSTLLNAFLGL